MAKFKIHFPTAEYAFIEQEVEGTVEDVIEAYNALESSYKAHSGAEGLGVRDWARVRNSFANTGKISVKDFEDLNKAQKWFINELKKVIRNNEGNNN